MIDINSRTWLTIRAYLQERLDTLRVRNDSSDMDAYKTAALRGEIAALKDLIALPERLAARDATGSLGYEVGSLDDED